MDNVSGTEPIDKATSLDYVWSYLPQTTMLEDISSRVDNIQTLTHDSARQINRGKPTAIVQLSDYDFGDAGNRTKVTKKGGATICTHKKATVTFGTAVISGSYPPPICSPLYKILSPAFH